MIILTDSQKEMVIKLLKVGLKAHGEIWVFGSRINPTTVKQFSDLDLVFIGTPPLGALQIEELKELFSASDLPFRVDLCNFADLPKALQAEVTKHHELLFKSPL
jgi:predicted nucleotidyltransferase